MSLCISCSACHGGRSVGSSGHLRLLDAAGPAGAAQGLQERPEGWSGSRSPAGVCVWACSHTWARTHSQAARASAAALSVCHLAAERVLLWMAAALKTCSEPISWTPPLFPKLLCCMISTCWFPGLTLLHRVLKLGCKLCLHQHRILALLCGVRETASSRDLTELFCGPSPCAQE